MLFWIVLLIYVFHLLIFCSFKCRYVNTTNNWSSWTPTLVTSNFYYRMCNPRSFKPNILCKI